MSTLASYRTPYPAPHDEREPVEQAALPDELADYVNAFVVDDDGDDQYFLTDTHIVYGLPDGFDDLEEALSFAEHEYEDRLLA
jgi:hypothetical protein